MSCAYARKINRTAVGLTQPSSHNLKYLVFFWMAASKGGHDDGIGGNIRVIKFRDDGGDLLARPPRPSLSASGRQP